MLGLGTQQAPSRPPEPGYYQDGEFGIRIEDVALVVEAQTKVVKRGWAAGVARHQWAAPGQGWGQPQHHLSAAAPERRESLPDLRGGITGAL